MPSVLVCRHDNLRGPLRTMLWLDGTVRPWVLGVFLERASCRRHYRDYTLTARLGWPCTLAASCAWILSLIVPPLMRSMGAIGVERGSARALSTLRETVRALCAGQTVILYPDVAYGERGGQVGALYDGYLLLARLYRRATGLDLAFVPVAAAGRQLAIGDAVYLSADEPRTGACARMRDALDCVGVTLKGRSP